VRVNVSYSDYLNGPIGQAEYLRELDQVVALATARGLVVEVSQGWANGPNNVVTFVTVLAGRYKANPLVWLEPDNEPNCNDGDTTKCHDWVYWQATERRYVQAIRAAGFTQPIVVNCIGWSWDCSQIGSYPLGDANLIYGPKRYGNGLSVFDAAQAASCDYLWGNLAATYPMFIDETGYDNGPGQVSPMVWGAGFLDYALIWTKTRHGNGALGWTDAWYNNSMTNYADGSWNAWGLIWITHFWSKA
jgi:hypothetical protein